LPAGALDDEPPDTQRLTEASGNEGASFERSYQHCVDFLIARSGNPPLALTDWRQNIHGIDANNTGRTSTPSPSLKASRVIATPRRPR
jgi:hypothetical protein